MSDKKSIATICMSILVTLAANASADYMTYEGMGYKSNVTVYAPNTIVHGKTVPAGEHLINYQGQDYIAWCVDINNWAGSGDVVEQDAMTALRNAHLVAYLYETYVPTVNSNTSAAALSLAIWEVINETQHDWHNRPIFNITGGNFKITSAPSSVLDQAQAMLNSMPISYTPTTNLVVLHQTNGQDLLISQVPEVSTLSLLSLGAGLVLRRRRSGSL